MSGYLGLQYLKHLKILEELLVSVNLNVKFIYNSLLIA